MCCLMVAESGDHGHINHTRRRQQEMSVRDKRLSVGGGGKGEKKERERVTAGCSSNRHTDSTFL